jgi:hypothetical protein
MPKADTWELGLLNLLFTNAAFAGVGDTNGLQPSAGAGSLYLSLHTSAPGDTGNQTTNEVTTGAYTGYARVAVTRSGAAWTVGETTGTASAANTAQVTFPLCTAGTGATITHVGVGTAASGAGKLLYYGALASSLAVSQNITPSFAALALVITED